MATQLGTGVNATSSVLSFAMLAIMGSTDHLLEWAHKRLALTLQHHYKEGANVARTNDGGTQALPQEGQPKPTGVGLEPTVLGQVAAAIVAAFRTRTGMNGDDTGVRNTTT
jgi:hypothetical protein